MPAWCGLVWCHLCCLSRSSRLVSPPSLFTGLGEGYVVPRTCRFSIDSGSGRLLKDQRKNRKIRRRRIPSPPLAPCHGMFASSRLNLAPHQRLVCLQKMLELSIHTSPCLSSWYGVVYMFALRLSGSSSKEDVEDDVTLTSVLFAHRLLMLLNHITPHHTTSHHIISHHKQYITS